jgi:anti-sigma factor RsiW
MTPIPHDPGRPDDATLHAYVDGHLDPATALRVAQWLATHPADAERVLAWQEQRTGLRELHAEVLDEPVPEALTRALVRPAPRWPYALAAGVMLMIGAVLGWTLRPVLQDAAGAPLATAPATRHFVQDAAIAHVVYLPEKRHPVEVGADQREHLVQWLSKRLGSELKAPSLDAQGFALIGGRLLPGGAEGAVVQAAPRAQFMYENDSGQRVTLYVSSFAEGALAPTAFQFASDGQTNTFYWVDRRQGYALSAQLPRAMLATLADAAYRQLER